MKLIQAILIVETRIEELTSMIQQIRNSTSDNVLKNISDRNHLRSYVELLKINQRVLKVLNGY